MTIADDSLIVDVSASMQHLNTENAICQHQESNFSGHWFSFLPFIVLNKFCLSHKDWAIPEELKLICIRSCCQIFGIPEKQSSLYIDMFKPKESNTHGNIDEICDVHILYSNI